MVNKGKPTFIWNMVGLKNIVWEDPNVLTPGKHTLALAVRNTLADRWRFALNYTQDTWSGATPERTRPGGVGGWGGEEGRVRGWREGE